MSWSVYAVVEDGDTTLLEEQYKNNKSAAVGNNYNDTTDEQFEFAMNVIQQAFDSEVVVGGYSVSVSGHSDPNQDNDRKSISLSFSPVYGAPAENNGPNNSDPVGGS